MQAHAFPVDVPGFAGGSRWMTYDELAAVRGIDRNAAVKLAVRHGWPKERDRYRIARVLVPAEWTTALQQEARAVPATHFETGLSGRAAGTHRSDQARAAERKMWRDLVTRERERADKVERECARLLGAVEGLETRVAATQADADAERAKADALKERAEAAEAELAAQRDEAASLRRRIQEVKELLTGVLRSQR